MPALVLSRIAKRYSPWGRWVLEDISLTLDPGTVTGISGSNGCGKSTLLRIASGASVPTRGEVSRSCVGRAALVPEQAPVNLRMSAAAYVMHMARLRRLTEVQARRRVDQLFDRLALSPSPDAAVRSLSKGNAQKVVLAQAFVAPVDLLVLDEPFSALDAAARRELASMITEAASQGAAVLLSSHESDGLVPTDRTLVLSRGSVR